MWYRESFSNCSYSTTVWIFEEESFVPALLLNGKAYSIVTDQLGTPTEAYNAEGKEVWFDRFKKAYEER